MNNQRPEKSIRSCSLQVNSLFLSVQGEGPFSGHRAFFIRLAGCNLQCPGCDTEYTKRKTFSVDKLLDNVKNEASPRTLVVITGGEPFRQNITPLCQALLAHGYHVQVESNGTLAPSPQLPDAVQIVCSPKTPRLNSKLFKRADAFKYVVKAEYVDHRGLPTQVLGNSKPPARPRPGVPIYIQPEDSKNEDQNTRNLIAVYWCSVHHGYIAQVQLHKLMGAL